MMSFTVLVLVAIMVQFESTLCSPAPDNSLQGTSSIFQPEAQTEPINFYWFTRQHQGIHINPDNITNDIYSSRKSCLTKFIVHGWTHNSKMAWVLDMTQSLLLDSDINVIAVDWKPLAAQLYGQSALSTQLVGAKLGELIVKFKNDLGYLLSDMHIIGHSLGSHVAGFAGKKVMELADIVKVGRITGLDPAGPFFEVPIFVGCSKRLCDTDAVFVDILHTDGNNFGFKRPIGHVDFYPNNGIAIQPGCDEIGLWLVEEYCSHGRAYDFYDESIYNDKFLAFPCKSYESFLDGYCTTGGVNMGYHLSPNTTGVYYLRTNPRSPYAMN